MKIVVVGGVSLDVVARVHRLPGPGETLAASGPARHPGGKGADQALAARRLGADVALVAAVGTAPAADETLAPLAAGGADLAAARRVPHRPSGHALITVDDDGGTTIVVAAGANAEPAVEPADVRGADAVLELPEAGLAVLDAAPARPVAAEVLRRVDVGGHDAAGAVVITRGGAGAELRRAGVVVATATPRPPPSSTAPGPAAASPSRCCRTAPTPCAAGAGAVSRAGAEPSLPTAAELEAVL